MKARNVGIEGRELPQDYRLEDEPDPHQKELQELRRKVLRLENAQPDLKIGFSQGNEALSQVTFDVSFDQETIGPAQITALVAKKEIELQNRDGGVASSAIALSFLYPGRDYLGKYRRFLEESEEIKIKKRHTLSLSVILENAGGSPANDIDIELCFPDGIQTNNRPLEMPSEPSPPTSVTGLFPGEVFSFPEDRLAILPPLDNFDRLPSKRGPIIDEADPKKVRFELDRLKQSFVETWNSLYLTFDVPAQLPTGFEIPYWIVAANIPDPIEGKLVIRLVKPEDD